MTIGEKIRELRKRKHITQETLARQFNISYQALSKWETNETIPDISLLPLLADYFEVSLDELFGRSGAQHGSGYQTGRERLMTVYECRGTQADFGCAAREYEEVFLKGTPSVGDYLDYAYLHDIRSRRDFETAYTYYDKAIQLGGDQRGAHWLQAIQQRTLLLIRHQKAAENLELLRAWKDREPQCAEAYISIAFAYFQMRKYDEAYRYARKAEAIDANHVTVLTVAGDICVRLKKYTEAASYFERAYQADPGSCACLYSKAEMLEEMDDPQAALAAWQAVVDWHIREGFDIGCEMQLPMEKVRQLMKKAAATQAD